MNKSAERIVRLLNVGQKNGDINGGKRGTSKKEELVRYERNECFATNGTVIGYVSGVA